MPFQFHSEILATEPNWRNYRQIPQTQLPYQWRNWLLDRGSLTQRLISASKGDFRVELLNLGWQRPSISEAKSLNISHRENALIREVTLVCFGQPWVYARSVIPFSTLRGPQRRLASLGNKPLGAYLFRNPSLKRGPLEIAKARLIADLAPDQNTIDPSYGRRSKFFLQQKPLLVAEIFMPALFAATNPN